jgi:hypothetical protein
MLGKILKYEFKSTARIFVLLYAALLVVASVNAFFFPAGNYSITAITQNSASGVSEGIGIISVFILNAAALVYAILVVAVLLMTLVISVVRFYRLLGDEGYLWLTLPVSADAHIISKLINSLVWFITSVLAVALSIGILLIRTGWLADIPALWNALMTSGITPWLWMVLLVCFALLAWINGIMMFYTAIAVGPSILKSRLGGSVIVYIAIYFIQQTVSGIMLFSGVLFASNQIEVLDNLTHATNLAQVASAELVGAVIVGCTCAFYAIFSVLLYICTRYFMTRKLNLA